MAASFCKPSETTASVVSSERLEVLDKVALLLFAEAEPEGTIVVVHNIAQRGESPVVEEAAFHMREETTERRRAVAAIRRSARLEVVDADLLGRLVLNLLDNAVRYSMAGGAVEVRMQRSNGRCAIRVTNGGPGIAPEAQPRRWGGLKVLLPPALLFFYMFAVEHLGFVPTAFVIVFALALALGASLRLAAPLAIVAPIVVHLIFAKLLRVPLPAGLLPMPW